MTEIILNKPENLILEDLIPVDRPFYPRKRKDDGTYSPIMTTGKRIRKQIPAMYYFIHMLLERQHSDVDELRCWFAKDFVQVYSRDIEPIKSKNDFRFIWGILKTLNVIEFHDDTRPNRYKKSAKVYFFKLTDNYVNSTIVQHRISINDSIAEKLNRKWNNLKKGDSEIKDIDYNKIDKVFLHQYNTLKYIRFDATKAKEHAEKLLSKNEINTKQYNTCLIRINNIVTGKIRVTYSESCNRFFTPVNQMPKELRQFFLDKDGNELVELDFVSCNPFIIYKILNEMQPDYKSDVEKIAFEHELYLYRRLLSAGDFYNSFKEYFFPDIDISRDQIKDDILHRWFNGRLNSRNKFRKRMLQRMPFISAVVDSMKSQRYEDYSNITMKFESQLVNEIIFKRFIEIHPDAIMYNIFDSFLIERRYATELLSLMQEEGSRFFNLNCFVRVK